MVRDIKGRRWLEPIEGERKSLKIGEKEEKISCFFAESDQAEKFIKYVQTCPSHPFFITSWYVVTKLNMVLPPCVNLNLYLFLLLHFVFAFAFVAFSQESTSWYVGSQFE